MEEAESGRSSLGLREAKVEMPVKERCIEFAAARTKKPLALVEGVSIGFELHHVSSCIQCICRQPGSQLPNVE